MSPAYILWNPDPTLVDMGFFQLQYYSLCFLLAFISSYVVLKKQFSHYGIDLLLLDQLTVYVFLGTLVGARLGHCLFYDFEYFSKHPLEIILPVSFHPFRITGYHGLASHGGGIGIMLSLLLFSRKFKINIWFLLDQIALVVPLAGFFIRIGNLMNSEIIGKPSSLGWAFVFEKDDMIPRHPAQLYEALAYFFIFLLCYRLMKHFVKGKGFYFGLVLVLIFSFRLGIEFLKEDQSAFESGMWLNMGQILSIPFIITGLVLMKIRKNIY